MVDRPDGGSWVIAIYNIHLLRKILLGVQTCAVLNELKLHWFTTVPVTCRCLGLSSLCDILSGIVTQLTAYDHLVR